MVFVDCWLCGECKNPHYGMCHKCGKCGRVFEDGLLTNYDQYPDIAEDSFF